MTTGALSAGEIVHLMVWRWQWEDGLTTHLGSTVAWNLAMYTNNVETYPELLTTLTARAEPVVYSDRDVPEPPYTVILHSGPLAADYDSATPLTGDVEVTGVLPTGMTALIRRFHRRTAASSDIGSWRPT